MSVTNAISSVIIVGAIIAGLSGNSESIFNNSSIFGFFCNIVGSNKYFWGIFSNSKNACDVQKKEKR
jgi:NAD(P) transhydrogenase subunit alpha